MKFPWAASLALLASDAQAHDPGLSALTMRTSNTVLAATLILARADAEAIVPLDANHDGWLTAEEFEKSRPPLERAAAGALELSLDGVLLDSASASAEFDSSDAIHLHLSFELPHGTQLRVRSAMLASLPRGHRQYVMLRDTQGQPLADKLLDASQMVFDAQLANTALAVESPRSASQFLWLGVEHITTGYDHLVFLLGLLIVGGSLRAVVKIITAFTVAHSITLALAALDHICLPSSVVEPLIAVSIMYVGIENVVRRDLERRWMLAFGFGLIHGCGFASVLRELGISGNGTGVLAPLLSFNLGVELGQVAIAALVLPVIWKLNRRESYQLRYVPTCSLSVTLAGAYWLAERTLTMVWH